ncbi:MAG: DUF1800 domain-containing protein [Hyphomicrobiales bacterium]
MTFNHAQIACHRFGLGALPNELEFAREMGIKQYLQDQLNNYQRSPQPIATLPSTVDILIFMGEVQSQVEQTKDKAQKQKIRKAARQKAQKYYVQAVAARHKEAVETPFSFNERLVYFWQNHFAVSAQKQQVRALAGCFENEAIRHNLMGNFSDLLLASTQHPAMQIFLDNFKSIGPESKKGQKRKKGLNENLAREILELHTLSVDGGYGQDDVIALAHMLTGWGYDVRKNFGFKFSPNAHQNKAQEFLGKTYPPNGVEQAKAALAFLGTHKNTAKFISQKLAHHFAGDQDSKLTKKLVTELQKSFIKTGGELKPLYEILIKHKACWQPTSLRFRTPNEWLISISRCVMLPELEPKKLVNILKNMGQQPYYATSPAGWPDRDKFWNSPSSFIQRWQYAKRLSKANKQNIRQVIITSLGNHIDDHTLLAMRKTKANGSKLTMLFLSQQMQFR